MRVRVLCLLSLTAVGCESLRPPTPVAPSPPPPAVPTPLPVAAPPAPKPPVEILRAAATQPADPPPPQEPAADDPLALVGECLQRTDLRGAALHLDGYVRAHPDQPMLRLRLADLYLRGEQVAAAKFEYERFAEAAESGPAALRPHAVTAHTRLMEIAQRRNDRFGELFHRGVGLYLLVKQQDADGEGEPEFREEMLCKALAALMEAKNLKPRDPQVRVYLAEVHARAGNRHAAEVERKGARADNARPAAGGEWEWPGR